MSALDQRLPHLFEHPAYRQRLPSIKTAGEGWYIGQSDIQGEGVFAEKDFAEGDVIGLAMTSGGEDDWGSKIWNLTLLARKCNHQRNHNVKIEKTQSLEGFNLVASKAIKQDDELVSSYYQVTRAVGPNSRLYWDGKAVPTSDFHDYIERETSDNATEEAGDRSESTI